jgi:hypothetical protein
VQFIKNLQSVVNEDVTVNTTEISFLTRNYVRQARGHHRSLCCSLCRPHYGKQWLITLSAAERAASNFDSQKCSFELLYEWVSLSDEYYNFQRTSHVIDKCYCVRKMCLMRNDKAHVCSLLNPFGVSLWYLETISDVFSRCILHEYEVFHDCDIKLL